MKGLLLLVALTLVIAAIFVVGYIHGRRTDPERLARSERKELKALRDLLHGLEVKALQNSNLPGEFFPAIVIDEINKTRNQIR